MNLFGNRRATLKKAASKTSAATKDEVISNLSKMQEAYDNLTKREEYLEKRMKTALNDAKEKSKNGDKKGALLQLRRKKLFEKEVEKIANLKATIEVQMHNIESTQTTAEVVTAMKNGANMQKDLTKRIGTIEQVEDLKDDIDESIRLTEEAQAILGTSFSADGLTEEELIAELESQELASGNATGGKNDSKNELEEEALKELELSLMPPAPNGKVNNINAMKKTLSKEQTEEEEELKKLEKELAM